MTPVMKYHVCSGSCGWARIEESKAGVAMAGRVAGDIGLRWGGDGGMGVGLDGGLQSRDGGILLCFEVHTNTPYWK